MVVEHERLREQQLGERQGASGVAGQEHPLGQVSRRAQVQGGAVRHRLRL